MPPPVPAAETIRAGSDISGAPFEFFARDGGRMTGFDIDLLQLIAAKLGRPVAIENEKFGQLLGDVQGGKLDLAISSMSDTLAREKRVDFVDYFLGGGGIVVPAGNPHNIYSIAALCGYSVAVEGGSVYDTDLQVQSKRCTALDLAPVRIASFATGEEAFAALTDGRTSAYVTDYPVGQYRARTFKDGRQFQMGARFHISLYGIAAAKSDPALRGAVARALQAVIASGEYDALLRKWSLEQGALRSVPINAGILFSE